MEIESIFREVSTEFGKTLKLSTEESAAPYFDWKRINISPHYFNLGASFIKNVMRHEYGHLFFSPRTPLVGLTINYIGKALGFEEPWIFTNIVTDLIVDMTNVELFKREYTRFLENSASLNSSRFHNFVFGVYREKAERLGIDTKLPRDRLGKRVFNILESEEMDFYTKIYRIGKLIKSNFSSSQLSFLAHSQIKTVNGDGYSPVDIARELKKHGSKELIESLFYEEESSSSDGSFKVTDDPVAVSYARNAILAKFIEYTSEPGLGNSHERFTDLWNLGDPPEQLDVLTTLTLYGSIIPGVHSVKQKNQNTRGHLDSKAKDVIIILDCSGSMSGENFETARGAVYFLTSEIISSGGKVGFIPFASGVDPEFTVPLTTDKSRILNILSRIMPDGGTNIYEPLEMAGTMDKNADIYIFTDAEVTDGDVSRALLKKMAGRTTMFLLSDYGRGEWYDLGGIRILEIVKEDLIKEIKKEVKK